jgi:hypothetical protein
VGGKVAVEDQRGADGVFAYFGWDVETSVRLADDLPMVWLAMARLWRMSQSAKAGSVTSGRVVFLDGYAGSGQYEDGSPGSPLLFVRAARQSAEMQRKVSAIFVEQHPDRYAQLCELLADACSTGVDYRTIKGDLGLIFPSCCLDRWFGAVRFSRSVRYGPGS